MVLGVQEAQTDTVLYTVWGSERVNGWIKKRSHTQKSQPKVVNPRDIAGECKKKNKKKEFKINKKENFQKLCYENGAPKTNRQTSKSHHTLRAYESLTNRQLALL